MDLTVLNSILTIGETVAVEFKRCGNGIESDTYESVCSFLNRFGGDIFMGVLDDGTVLGVPEKSASDMVKNFISVISNPAVFSPTIYLSPEILRDDAGHTIIHVHVPPSAEVHSYKRVIYDRVDDADVKVTATGQIAAMYIRKQNVFTEKKIFPFVAMEDLRLDLLPKVRQMAITHAGGKHPWESMGDQELLQSAGLYGVDLATGEKGYNLAAVMLLGKDDIILNACPAYETDALVRKVNIDRYDDREIVRTNLIESYDLLMEFARKHLPDKFFLEDAINVSLRNILAREMLGNLLMHREFTSTYAAKFIIENNRMYVENASRATRAGEITPENLEPNPKNPIIASFFRNIGRADRLGSGVRKLFKYSKYYSGQDPQFIEGDVFRIIVPLDDGYSFDYTLTDSKSPPAPQGHALRDALGYTLTDSQSPLARSASDTVCPDGYKLNEEKLMIEDMKDEYVFNETKIDWTAELPISDNRVLVSADKSQKGADKMPINCSEVPINADKSLESADKPLENVEKSTGDNLSARQKQIFEFVLAHGQITSSQAELLLGVKQRRARSILGEMVTLNILKRQGAYKSTTYVLGERKIN